MLKCNMFVPLTLHSRIGPEQGEWIGVCTLHVTQALCCPYSPQVECMNKPLLFNRALNGINVISRTMESRADKKMPLVVGKLNSRDSS